MDFSSKKYLINQKEILHEGTVEQMVESDITLPDYCSDISKILKCKIEPQIFSTNITGDRVTVEGKAQIRLIYSDENNCIKSYEQSYPFSKYFEDASVSENISARFKSKVEYVNCRAISARKADVRANIVFAFKLIKKNTQEIVCESEGAEIQVKKEICNAVDFCTLAEKVFSVGEVLQLPSDLPSVAQIIRENAVIIPGEIKFINNKVLFKAELNIALLYSDSENNMHIYKDTIPVTQVIETDVSEDNAYVNLHLDISSLEIQLKNDANSETRLFDINSRISAVAEIYCEKEFSGILDAYSTKYDVELKKKPIKLLKKVASISESALYKDELDFSTTGISKVIDTWAMNIRTKTEYKDDMVVFVNSATACIIYEDRESVPCYAEREIAFEYKKSLENTIDTNSRPDIKIIDIKAIPLGETSCEFKIEYYLSGEIFDSEVKYLITDVVPDDTKLKTNDTSAVTLYFADINENVWDIARRYNSKVERIMAENSLSNELLTEKCMLMITSD